MFGMIKSLIVLCLIVGVIVLGAKIHQKSSDLDKEMDFKHRKVQEKISIIKKDVLNKAEDLEKVYEHVNKKLNEVLEQKQTETGKDHARNEKKPESELLSKKEGDTKKVQIDPVDEEDRTLTEEILKEDTGKRDQAGFSWKVDENVTEETPEEIPIQVSLIEEEKFTPMDLNKAAEIRELYLKAIETLDFK